MKGPTLVSAQQIIDYLEISERMFRRKYMVHPDWPRAVTPPRIPFADRRWYESEVLCAIDRIRGKWSKAA